MLRLNRSMVRILIPGVAYLTLAGVHAGPAAPDYAAALDRYFSSEVLPAVPGAAMAVVDHGQVAWTQVGGVRDTRSRQPVTRDTVFRLASVSKSFASAAAALLVERNALHWEDPVDTNLDYVRFKNQRYGRQITLQNLLSQTTGLVPHAYTNLIEDNVAYPEVVRRLRNVDFVCPPGTCYSYQNVAYSLSGDLIQQASGERYEDFVVEQLFRPLGMDHASYGMQAFLGSPDHATPHVLQHQRWMPVKVNANYYRVAPAAGVNASITDVSLWLLAQLGQRPDVLSDPVLRVLHERRIRTTRSQAHYRKRAGLGAVYYGLGWRIFDYGGYSGFVHHGGGVRGTRAELVFNPQLQIGMAFLTNGATRDTSDVVFEFLDIYRRYHPPPGPARGAAAAGG